MHFTDYEELYFATLDITAGPEDDERFELLSESARALFILAMFDMEIQNGGLCQFFTNCGSAYATGVTPSLRMIGADAIGDTFDMFLSEHQIDLADLSSFEIETTDDFSRRYERYPFDDFDDRYMKLWNETDFQGMMMRYANAHPEAFAGV